MSIQLIPRMLRRRPAVEPSEYPGDEFFANLQSRPTKPAGLPDFDLLETLDERMADPPPAAAPRKVQPEIEIPKGARFTLRTPIGEDMLGQMYEAWDSTLGRIVAVKTVQLHVNNPARALLDNLFLQEAQAAARLTHPHIVKVHHVGLSAHGVYIAMERLHGGELQRALDEGWRPSTAQAVLMVRRVADALAYAHARGVLHCNIKPANIFVLPDGRPKVMNFGMARAAHGTNIPELDGLALGSPHYLSPEQLQGAEVDARTDIHALGVMLYELLTGSRAFPGHTVSQIAAALLQHQPVPAQTAQPGLPPALAAIVARAMARHPAERYQKASEMALALRNWAESHEAGASRLSRWRGNPDDDGEDRASRPMPMDDEPVQASHDGQGFASAHEHGPDHPAHAAHAAAPITPLGVGFIVSPDVRKGGSRGKAGSKHSKHVGRDPVVTAPVDLSPPPPPKRSNIGRLSTQLLVGGLVLAALASAALSLREQARARQAVPEVAVAPDGSTSPITVAAPAPDTVIVPNLPEVSVTPPAADGAPSAPLASADSGAAPSVNGTLAAPNAPNVSTGAPAAPLPSPVVEITNNAPVAPALPVVSVAPPAPVVTAAPTAPPVPKISAALPEPSRSAPNVPPIAAPKDDPKKAARATTAAPVTAPTAAAISRKTAGSAGPAMAGTVDPSAAAPSRKPSTGATGPALGGATPAVPVAVAPTAPLAREAAAPVTGTVRLAISPWGHVEVDGAAAGTSPPLTRLSLSEGKHTITVRNDDAPPYTVTVTVTADEPVTVRHRFGP